MVRIKRGNVARKRRKKILKLAKGYRGAHSRLFRPSNQQVLHARSYSYVGRKLLKRAYRRNWITHINTQVRRHNRTYSQLFSLFKKKRIAINRKILSNLIANDPLMFDYLILKTV
jgi:large subunit ribosomal protein L20